MDKRKKCFLATLYTLIAIGFMVSIALYVPELIPFNLFVATAGLILGSLQIVLAVHILWWQNFSEEELKAIIEIFKTVGGKDVIRVLCNYGSVTYSDIFNVIGGSRTTISSALLVLENEKIILSKPLFSSRTYTRLYSLNPNYRRIVEKFRPAL